MRWKSFFFAAGVAMFLINAAAFGQGPVVIYDPMRNAPEQNYTKEDEDLVTKLLLPKVNKRWSDETCDGSNINIIGAVNGSFTKKDAEQRAIVYELCQTGNGFANNGIAVFENDSVIAHFVTEGGWNVDVLRVGDINKDGFDELVIETGGGMHQGYMGSSSTVLEISESSIKTLGSFLVYSNECESLKPGKYCDRSYKITAKPGSSPSFSQQMFVNKGDDETPKWVASGGNSTAKRLAGTNIQYTLVK